MKVMKTSIRTNLAMTSEVLGSSSSNSKWAPSRCTIKHLFKCSLNSRWWAISLTRLSHSRTAWVALVLTQAMIKFSKWSRCSKCPRCSILWKSKKPLKKSPVYSDASSTYSSPTQRKRLKLKFQLRKKCKSKTDKKRWILPLKPHQCHLVRNSSKK